MKKEIRTLTNKEVEILSHEVKYKGYFSIEQYQLRYKLFQDGFSKTLTREIFERGKVAAVLPYDPVLKKVVLIEQFRIGALEDEKSPWLLEIVAGVMDSGETPEQLAHRESKEEAGLEILELLPLYQYWVSPGGCTEHVNLFCGRIDASKAGGIHGITDEGEDIRVHVFDLNEAFQLLHEGLITNAVAIIALQWLELNYKKISIQYNNQ